MLVTCLSTPMIYYKIALVDAIFSFNDKLYFLIGPKILSY